MEKRRASPTGHRQAQLQKTWNRSRPRLIHPLARIPAGPVVTPQVYEQLMDMLDRCIGTVAAAKLAETALLLRVAQLDLAARVNGVTEDELELFAAALRRKS